MEERKGKLKIPNTFVFIYFGRKEEKKKKKNFTFDTADVIVELLLEFVGRILLLVEILDVIVEYLVGCPVHFAHLLQDLPKTGKTNYYQKTNYNTNKREKRLLFFWSRLVGPAYPPIIQRRRRSRALR